MMGKNNELSQDLHNLIVAKTTDATGSCEHYWGHNLEVEISSFHHKPQLDTPRKILDRGVKRIIRTVENWATTTPDACNVSSRILKLSPPTQKY